MRFAAPGMLLIVGHEPLLQDRSSLKAQEAKLSATESVLKDKQQQLAAAAAAACAAAGSVVLPAEVAGGMGEASVKSTTKLNQQGSKVCHHSLKRNLVIFEAPLSTFPIQFRPPYFF
eukprot:scaffold144660_cov28-Tisochrysis_lutea.AAC.3